MMVLKVRPSDTIVMGCVNLHSSARQQQQQE
jgi:hypothetical protein